MQSMSLVHTLGWLVCLVYSTIPSFWLMIHPHADAWRKRRSPYRILLPAWMLMWVIVAAVTAHWRGMAIYSTPWTWIVAALLFVIGIWLYRQSGAHFSWKQLGGIPEIRPRQRDQKLVTSGIRGRVRHPVYLGHLCELLAWSIGTGLVVCWALTVFAMITGAVMIRMEDAELEKRFGNEYSAYRQRVPAVVPRLGS